MDHLASHIQRFSHDDWAALAQSTPLPLPHSDIRRLSALGDPIELHEADAIYRPLTALIQMYYAEVGKLHATTSSFLGLTEKRTPFIIGIAGSVAVGKSTTSRLLQELLRRWPETPRVDLVTTDGFLYSNVELERRGLTFRKGFPESYDRTNLLAFLKKVKSGESAHVPVYDHVIYDIVPDRHIEINQPDILIIEGLNVLQPPRMSASRELLAVSDFFDVSIYVDADEEHIRRWYVERVLRLREIAFNQPSSYFYQFSQMPEEEMVERALGIWESINKPNLVENIEPTRSRANIVLRKGPDHIITDVLMRKI